MSLTYTYLHSKEGHRLMIEPVFMGVDKHEGYRVLIIAPNGVTVLGHRATYPTPEQAQADAVLVHLKGEAAA